jgi:hypothetical protein
VWRAGFVKADAKTTPIQQRRVPKLHDERKLLLLAAMSIQHLAATEVRVKALEEVLLDYQSVGLFQLEPCWCILNFSGSENPYK